MKFEINGLNYEIKEVSSKVMYEVAEINKEPGMDRLGQHSSIEQIIYINEKLTPDMKKRTLLHELMHCYIWSYLSNLEFYNEETLCDISANSHDVIHKIAEDYFK
jgi:Zn-dependent peptidase ImmA (M78 family)